MNVNMSTGPSYFTDMRALRNAVDRNRSGMEQLVVQAPGDAVATLLLNRHSLYIAAFRGAGGTWYRFKDDDVPAAYKAIALPEGGNYNDLGGLDFKISKVSLAGIACLGRYAGKGYGADERKALRQLIVGISEALRFANVITWMMAVLNANQEFAVSRLATEIRNWSVGSRAGSLGILVEHL